MICSLMLDPDDSLDFPGSTATALGRPLAAYPFIAARATAQIGRHYVVTGTLPVKSVALQNGAVIIDPPPASDSGSMHKKDMLVHGYRALRQDLKGDEGKLELVCLFLANAPTVTPELLNEGLEAMASRPDLDSAVSVSPHNRMNPYSARRESADGLLEPYVPQPAPQGKLPEAWFPDWGVQFLRPRALDAMDGAGPMPWLGRKVLPLKQWGCAPVDFQWQIPGLEYWLKKQGFSDLTPSLELQPKPQPQLAPREGRR